MSITNDQTQAGPAKADDAVAPRSERDGPLPDDSDQEVQQRYQQAVQHVTPDAYEQAAREAFTRLTAQERLQLLQLICQHAEQQGLPLPSLAPGTEQDPNAMARFVAQVRAQHPELLERLLEPTDAGPSAVRWEDLDAQTRAAFTRQFGEHAAAEWQRQSARARARSTHPVTRAALTAITAAVQGHGAAGR